MRGASESHRASGDERLPWCRSQRRAADIRPWARGCHQLTDEIGSLHLVKTGIRGQRLPRMTKQRQSGFTTR
jgi:hypothetical protein